MPLRRGIRCNRWIPLGENLAGEGVVLGPVVNEVLERQKEAGKAKPIRQQYTEFEGLQALLVLKKTIGDLPC